MDGRKRAMRAAILMAGLVAAALIVRWSAASAVQSDREVERLRRLSHDLVKVEPLIRRLEKMQDVIRAVRATSPTLEQLGQIEIKAESVAKMEALLARMEKIEPLLAAFEEIQDDLAKRQVEKERFGPKKKRPSLAGFFLAMQKRLDALERDIYDRRTPTSSTMARRKPLEVRLRALEQRQKALLEEMEKLRREMRRLRRSVVEQPF